MERTAMQRKNIASLFKRAVEQYLREKGPRYKNGRYAVSEKELQKQFALILMDANIPFRKEQYYRGDKKRIDFRLFSDSDAGFDVEMEIEIEWEAKWTDGFSKRTFEDLHKLDKLHRGEWGMFLAVNIGNKYERARGGRPSNTKNAARFFKAGKTHQRKYAKHKAKHATTFLERKWSESKGNGESGLLKCNPRFWRWRYDKSCDVTVLTCFGKRTHNGWTARWAAT
jgi:hypothetical protein